MTSSAGSIARLLCALPSGHRHFTADSACPSPALRTHRLTLYVRPPCSSVSRNHDFLQRALASSATQHLRRHPRGLLGRLYVISAITVHVNGGPKSASPTRVTSATANCQYPTATYPRINGPAHANVCFLQRRHACSGPPPGSPLSIWGHEPAKPYAPTTTTADSGDGQLTAATGAMPQLHRRHLLFRRRL